MSNFVGVFTCIFILTICSRIVVGENSGVLDKIKTGLQYATDYLEAAKDIADLVSRSLSHKREEKLGETTDEIPQQNFGPSNLVSAFFRLLGLDSQKITAIAVNSVIFLAQVISSLFGLTPVQNAEGRNLDDEETSWDLMKLILENQNERVQNLIEQAQDPNLPSQLINKMDGFDSSCIRLLLCKTSPVIRAAQDSLKNKMQRQNHPMTAWLPSREIFEMNSDDCEDKYSDCNLFPES